MWTETIFAPKTGREWRHLPALVLNLPWKLPEPAGSLRLPCRDTPPPWPATRATYYVCEVLWDSTVQCALPKGSHVRTLGGIQNLPNKHQGRGERECRQGSQELTLSQAGLGMWLSWESAFTHVRKPGVPSTQPLGSQSRGATWALSSAHIQPSVIPRVTDKHQRWSQSPSVLGTTGLSRSQIKPRNTLFCDVS